MRLQMVRRWPLLAGIVLTLPGIVGTTCGGNQFLFELAGSGFGEHDGQTIYGAVIDTASGAVLERGSAVVTGGEFTVTVMIDSCCGPDGIRFHYFADVNANGRCDPPPADHVWTSPPTSVAYVACPGPCNGIAVTHSTSFQPAACDRF